MNCLRFLSKKRPHEQPPYRNLQQPVEEVSAIQANVVVGEPVDVQRLVKAQQTTVEELEKNQQNLQKLVGALSERVGRFEAAKFVERKRIGQMELELKETNKKLEELGNNSKDVMEKPRRGVTKLKKDMARLIEEQNRQFEQQLDELGNNAENALDKALRAKTVIELKEYQALMNAYDVLQEKSHIFTYSQLQAALACVALLTAIYPPTFIQEDDMLLFILIVAVGQINLATTAYTPTAFYGICLLWMVGTKVWKVYCHANAGHHQSAPPNVPLATDNYSHERMRLYTICILGTMPPFVLTVFMQNLQ
uniref:Transmembrane protein n=1 Tax=Globodera pallida TaxID=36090 RepID=A0A183C2G5_GLOPA